MDIRSKILDYLLSFLVMEEPREACYLSDDLCNIFQEEFWGKRSFIYSGSFVEGLINHGDVDIMHVADDFLVVEHPDNIPESFKEAVLLMEPGHCEPGYTRLRLFCDIPGNQFEIYTNEGDKLYLDRIKYLKIKFGKHEMLNVDMHGPALLTFNHVAKGDTDMVECFHCPLWPTFARREFVVYQNNVKNIKTENITKAGCHIVPIAHPKSSNPDLEFRMSFSVAERFLIQNWNKKQIDIYFLCKELFNKFFSTDHNLEKGLCSYFAKTLIYWMNEQSSIDFWTNNSIISILGQFFDLLRAYIANKSCPNYFIPNNLMMSTYTDKQINSLLTRLDDVCQDIFYYIICCDIFNFADNELLASLYKTITLAGNQSDVTEILTSMYLSDFINRCNKEFLQLGGIKRVNRYKFIHYYYHNFMRFCLGRFLVGVPLHLKQELLKVTKRIDELYYSSYLMECANMYINRCLAIIAFSALFHEQTQMRNKLMKDSEKLFLLSMDVPGELSDGGISGGVYLGLFYYLTDQREKTKLY